MLGFPVPYDDELIYSTVARAGVHFGLTSPKELLDEVFENRKVIATVDLPSHLGAITHLYPECLGLTLEQLAYKHTLFPLYAPFMPENRRKQCLSGMADNSRGIVHLASGVVASRVKQPHFLMYCPQCVKRQRAEKGEYYWKRMWQVTGADCCPEHGQLVPAKIKRHGYHRHEFFPSTPLNCPDTDKSQETASPQSIAILTQASFLLSMPPQYSPTFQQWSLFYISLAIDNGCSRRTQIHYDALKQRVIEKWGNDWLNTNQLSVTDNQSCWLRCIFRKHRKSFSYLEHIVAISPFLSKNWKINDVIGKIKRLNKSKVTHSPIEIPLSRKKTIKHREDWLNLVIKYGTKIARIKGGGASYAYLYKHDKAWLITINSQYKKPSISINHRVNWRSRDLQFVRELLNIRDDYEYALNSPRHSRNWYFSKMDHAPTVEKKLSKLPLCQSFFNKYCESIEEHQIRRISYAVIRLNKQQQAIKRWKVLRLSGLSEERLKELSKDFLALIIDN